MSQTLKNARFLEKSRAGISLLWRWRGLGDYRRPIAITQS